MNPIKTGVTAVKILMRVLAGIAVLSTLAACDIRPVGEGNWDIQVQTTYNVRSTTWSMSEDGTVTISGDISANITDAQFAGSRVSWSGLISNPDMPDENLSVNFSGTVDGNTIQGTLFSTLGNWTVAGTRQR